MPPIGKVTHEQCVQPLREEWNGWWESFKVVLAECDWLTLFGRVASGHVEGMWDAYVQLLLPWLKLLPCLRLLLRHCLCVHALNPLPCLKLLPCPKLLLLLRHQCHYVEVHAVKFAGHQENRPLEDVCQCAVCQHSIRCAQFWN